MCVCVWERENESKMYNVCIFFKIQPKYDDALSDTNKNTLHTRTNIIYESAELCLVTTLIEISVRTHFVIID